MPPTKTDGLTGVTERQRYTDEELLSVIREEYAISGEIPSRGAQRSIHCGNYDRRFGKWNAALSAAGIPVKAATTKRVYEVRACQQCSTTFSAEVRSERRFCATTCSNKSRSLCKPPRRSRDEWRRHLANQSTQYLLQDFNELGWDSRRRRVILEQDGKCNKCGAMEWMGVTLSLDVDHINGDNTDHRRENLEALCPNCHSITPTYKGKNKRTKPAVPDEVLKDALKSHDSIRQALISVGMSPRGANYRRAHELHTQLD